MARNLVYIGIVVLAIIAVVLGYNIYKQQLAYKQTLTQKQTVIPKKQLRPTPPSQTSSVSNTMSEDRQKIATYPGPSAPDDQKKELSRIIEKNVQVSDTLNVTQCNTTPLVLQTIKGADIKLVNDDSVVRSIMFGPGKQYDVPIKKTLTIKPDLNNGINFYRCNLTGSPIVGIVLIK